MFFRRAIAGWAGERDGAKAHKLHNLDVLVHTLRSEMENRQKKHENKRKTLSFVLSDNETVYVQPKPART